MPRCLRGKGRWPRNSMRTERLTRRRSASFDLPRWRPSGSPPYDHTAPGLGVHRRCPEAAGERVAVVDAVASAPDSLRRYFKGYLIGLSFDEIAARIPTGVDFIGISVVFTHEWPAVVCLIEAIKRRHPDVPVILGGEHISSMPEFCLLHLRRATCWCSARVRRPSSNCSTRSATSNPSTRSMASPIARATTSW